MKLTHIVVHIYENILYLTSTFNQISVYRSIYLCDIFHILDFNLHYFCLRIYIYMFKISYQFNKKPKIKLPDLILSLLCMLKMHRGCKTFFAHNVSLCNSVTFKFWVTLEFSRRHGNLMPKRFDFYIKCKPIDRTCPFQYHWLDLFGLLEEIGIESSVAFLKCFSIYKYIY